jgi:hypothetical protein
MWLDAQADRSSARTIRDARAQIVAERLSEVERATHQMSNRAGPQPSLQATRELSEDGH